MNPLTGWALIGLAACLWLHLRTSLLRQREALREEGEDPVPAPEWLRRLSRSSRTRPVLVFSASVLLAVLAWSVLAP